MYIVVHFPETLLNATVQGQYKQLLLKKEVNKTVV